MKRGIAIHAGGFTLIEVLLAMSILSLVIGAVYSSWIGIVKASRVGVEAAAAAQRERMAMRVVEEALGSAQLFVANPRYYSFVPDKAVSGSYSLSFVARLPKSFPRSGKFGDFDVRRVTFTVEPGQNSKKQLVLRQRPILMEELDEDEKVHPVVLARDVKKFLAEYWDPTVNDWIDEWTLTNQFPKMVQVTLQLNYQGTQAPIPGEVVTRVVSVPTSGVQPMWQVPTQQGGGAPPPPGGGGSRSPQFAHPPWWHPTMKIAIQSGRSGIAMIIVMVTIFVLAMLAGGFALSMKVETKLARNASNEAELEWIGRSGVELARWILGQSMSCPYDSLNQKWAGGPGNECETNGPLGEISLKDHKLGNGTYSITITDLERKLNINQALNSPAMLEQVFILMGADAGEFPAVVGAIQDWLDADDNMHIGGAESDYYQGLNPPYMAKNGPIDDLSELLLIKGVTSEMYNGGSPTNYNQAVFQRKLGPMGRNTPVSYAFGLASVFTPLSSGRININTASEQVLQLIPGMDPNISTEIIRLRSGPDGADGTEDDTPLRGVGELVNVGIGNQATGQLARFTDVRSRTFEVQVDAEIGGYKRHYIAIVGRNSQKDIQVLSFYWKTP